mgnify:CR=1 FL=1
MGMSITSQKNFNIMSAKEKEAAAKQTFTFLAPLTNEQSCEAGRKSAKRGFVSIDEPKEKGGRN